jgi:hypothetical protein
MGSSVRFNKLVKAEFVVRWILTNGKESAENAPSRQ